MKAWMVRYLKEKVEFHRLFQEQEDAVTFLQSLGGGCVPLDSEPQAVSPEEFSEYQLRLKTTLR